jgi:hypothetical protein
MYFRPQNLCRQINAIHYLKFHLNPVEAAQNIISFNYVKQRLSRKSNHLLWTPQVLLPYLLESANRILGETLWVQGYPFLGQRNMEH